MLAPGPAGTSMIGESNIDAAARRGRERHRREAENKRAVNDEKGTSGQSETKNSLVTSEYDSQRDKDSEDARYAAQGPIAATSEREDPKKGLRRAWERIKTKF
ncbi:hypothetical protein N7468_008955 [Penicillium chermesinum]|uniref:Uncharacterized protein n=1 Tax=Penicillium chermesinum TaxID=63820 RepID=A0A9W9NGX7_9EURO|nr:uncharacterized protein N7468_008955 [Penicillium chermesinum]KAJ5219751.1 hypothetical protein N7468_008955 [Penicillium chermesinum]